MDPVPGVEVVQSLGYIPRDRAYFHQVDAADAAVDYLLAQAFLGKLKDEDAVVPLEPVGGCVAPLARREQTS